MTKQEEMLAKLNQKRKEQNNEEAQMVEVFLQSGDEIIEISQEDYQNLIKTAPVVRFEDMFFGDVENQ